MTRNVHRRLERLEAQANTAAAIAAREHHIICFVDMQRRVRSQVQWKNGKNVWTYFDEDGAIERVEEK